MHTVWVFPDAKAEIHLIKQAEENKQAWQDTGQKTDADSQLADTESSGPQEATSLYYIC